MQLQQRARAESPAASSNLRQARQPLAALPPTQVWEPPPFRNDAPLNHRHPLTQLVPKSSPAQLIGSAVLLTVWSAQFEYPQLVYPLSEFPQRARMCPTRMRMREAETRQILLWMPLVRMPLRSQLGQRSIDPECCRDPSR